MEAPCKVRRRRLCRMIARKCRNSRGRVLTFNASYAILGSNIVIKNWSEYDEENSDFRDKESLRNRKEGRLR